jgi:hypothetical protein
MMPMTMAAAPAADSRKDWPKIAKTTKMIENTVDITATTATAFLLKFDPCVQTYAKWSEAASA